MTLLLILIIATFILKTFHVTQTEVTNISDVENKYFICCFKDNYNN